MLSPVPRQETIAKQLLIDNHTWLSWFDELVSQMNPKKGTTAQRPKLKVSDRGVQYFDTTLAAAGKPIWWTGTAWTDANGNIV